MEFTLSQQTVYFLYSILFGIILSVLYDIVRILRFCGFNRAWQIVLSDVLYFVLCAFLTVLFALPFNKGEVRYFVLFGEALGFVLYRFTVGEYSARIYQFFIHIISMLFRKTFKYLIKISNKVLKANRFVVYNIGVVVKKLQNIVFKKRKGNFYEHKKRDKT